VGCLIPVPGAAVTSVIYEPIFILFYVPILYYEYLSIFSVFLLTCLMVYVLLLFQRSIYPSQWVWMLCVSSVLASAFIPCLIGEGKGENGGSVYSVVLCIFCIMFRIWGYMCRCLCHSYLDCPYWLYKYDIFPMHSNTFLFSRCYNFHGILHCSIGVSCI
jgi:hypothetical protein